MTHRSIPALQRANHSCRACAEAGYPLESPPVVELYRGQRAYLLGQAPGRLEGEEQRPWRGRAGQTLRRWLRLDEEAFYTTFYCAAVTRCYPGRAASGRGDRAPSRREQELCAGWRERELRLIRPELIVTAGALALQHVLGLAGLTASVGEQLSLAGTPVIPLPHPSGASGWLNDATNRARLERALALVESGLATLPGTRARGAARGRSPAGGHATRRG